MKEKIDHILDTKGLTCPEPVMLLHSVVRDAAHGERIKVEATDPATTRDIPKFCQFLGHKLLDQLETKQQTIIGSESFSTLYEFVIERGEKG